MGFQNFFATRLATEIGASDTIITLENVPSKTSGKLVLEARNPTQREIITYTGISGNQITGVTRGYGGTTAKPHLKNALVEMNLTAEDLQELYDLFGTGNVEINGAKLKDASVESQKLKVAIGASVTLNANQSHGSNASYVITKFDTVEFLKGISYSTSTGKFTAQTAGYYHFSAHAMANNPDRGNVIGQMVKNSTVIAEDKGIPATSNDEYCVNLYRNMYLNVGDTVHLQVAVQNGNREIFGGKAYTYMNAHYLGS